MATKKKSGGKKKSSSRRGGVRGFNAQHTMEQIGGVAVGAAIAGLLVSKVLKKQSPTIQAGAAVVGGALVPMFMKNSFGQAVGNGMAAVGVITGLRKANIISGVGDADFTVPVAVNGADDDLSAIAGDDDFAMAGADDDYAMAGADDDDLSAIGALDDDE